MKLKKTIYVILSVLLFIILSYGLHALVEIIVINSTDNPTWYTHFGGQCTLHPVISYGLLALGIISGIMAGFKWWKMVYIEHRHRKFRKLNNKEINTNG